MLGVRPGNFEFVAICQYFCTSLYVCRPRCSTFLLRRQQPSPLLLSIWTAAGVGILVQLQHQPGAVLRFCKHASCHAMALRVNSARVEKGKSTEKVIIHTAHGSQPPYLGQDHHQSPTQACNATRSFKRTTKHTKILFRVDKNDRQTVRKLYSYHRPVFAQPERRAASKAHTPSTESESSEEYITRSTSAKRQRTSKSRRGSRDDKQQSTPP